MRTSLSDQQHAEMTDVSKGLATKAAKIRALGEAGYKRADIARHLGIKYQHVRNVLERKQEADEAARERSRSPSEGDVVRPSWGQIGPDGRLLIPAPFRKKLGFDRDGRVLMCIEDGLLRLMNRDQALDHARSLVAKYVPAGTSLVDELIAERQREVAYDEDQ